MSKKDNIFKSNFFLKLFGIPTGIWIFLSLISMTDQSDAEPMTWGEFIVSNIVIIGIWFGISFIIYLFINKNIRNKPKVKNVKEVKHMNKNEKKLIVEDTNIIMKELKKRSKKRINNNCLFTCESNWNASKYQEAVPYFPFIYYDYLKKGTIYCIIAFLIYLYISNIYLSIYVFIFLELIIIIVYKYNIKSMARATFIKDVKKNPSFDKNFINAFYDDYFERIGKYATRKIYYKAIIKLVETNDFIYLQGNDKKIYNFSKNNLTEKDILFLKEKIHEQKEHPNLKLVIIIVSLILLLIANFIASHISMNKYNNFDNIALYVNENYNNLNEYVIKDLNSEHPKIPKSVNNVIKWYGNEDRAIIIFVLNRKNLILKSDNYGFYYSKNNIPISLNNEYELEQYNENEWGWNGSNNSYGKIIKIKDYWYYFETHSN